MNSLHVVTTLTRSGCKVATIRVVRCGRRRYDAMVLARCGDDRATDLWFVIQRTRTRRGAWSAARRFVALQAIGEEV